jgi:hypothetical protein
MYTRKQRRGGGFFKPRGSSEANKLKAERNYKLAHSKSRVANVLGTPGSVRYTNKERIEQSYQAAIEHLKQLENPKETVSALRSIVDRVRTALQSTEARKTGAIAITIPVGIAQLFVKAALVMLAVLAALFVDIPSMGTIPVSTSLFPNRSFNTTEDVYRRAKQFTGVNTVPPVSDF